MGKIYTDKDVLTAALERFKIVFNEFDNVYLSISGGKDSSVMAQLCAMVARQNRKIYVLYIDLEAQYKATIKHIEELLRNDNRGSLLVLSASQFAECSLGYPTKWICWDKNDKTNGFVKCQILIALLMRIITRRMDVV